MGSIDEQKPISEVSATYPKWQFPDVSSSLLLFFKGIGGWILLGGVLGAVALYLHFWSLLLVPLLLVSFFLIARPLYAVLLFVWFLPEIREIDVAKYFYAHHWFYPLAILYVGWFVQLLIRYRETFMSKKYLGVYMGFLLACVCSWQFGADIASFVPYEESLFVKLFTVPQYRMIWEPYIASLLCFPVMAAIKTPRRLSWVVWCLVISGVFYTSTLFFMGQQSSVLETTVRSRGIFTHPINAGVYIMIPTILSVTLAYYETSFKKRILLILPLLICLGGLQMAVAKTAIVALFLIFVAAILLEMDMSKVVRYGTLTIAGTVLGGLFLSLISNRVQMIARQIILNFLGTSLKMETGFGSGLNSFGGRIILCQAGLKIFAKYPLFGVGTGKHSYFLPSIGNLPDFFLRPWGLIHTHYITILAEIGLFGFIFYMAIISLALYDLFQAFFYFKHLENRQMYYLCKGLLLTFIAILIGYLGVPPHRTEFAFWLFIGLAAAVGQMAKKDKERGEKVTQAAC